MNARDTASVNELAVISNMESLNSIMIRSGMPNYERGPELRRLAQQQLAALAAVNIENSYSKMIGTHKGPKKIENKAPLRAAKEIIESGLSPFDKALKQALHFNSKEEKL